MNKKTLALTLGGAIVTALTASPIVHAQENPFAMQKISGVSLAQADAKTSEGACSANKMKEGKCGEGKCGANKKKMEEDMKMKEGSCSGKMKEGGCSNKMKEAGCSGKM